MVVLSQSLHIASVFPSYQNFEELIHFFNAKLVLLYSLLKVEKNKVLCTCLYLRNINNRWFTADKDLSEVNLKFQTYFKIINIIFKELVENFNPLNSKPNY